MEYLKKLKGHSGNEVYLIRNDKHLYVHKEGNIIRNVERLRALYKEFYKVPKILKTNEETFLDMEYVHGLDMKQYLKNNNISGLTSFIINTLNGFAENSVDFDYTNVYHNKLHWVNQASDLPFKKEELIERLPKILPKSTYHGDFTLENLLYSKNGFMMIDAVTIEYDSYVFDIAKLQQDLKCKWFLRKSRLKLDVKLKNIQEKILKHFKNTYNDYLLILMLLRVYRHTKIGDSNYKFIMKEIKKLWK